MKPSFTVLHYRSFCQLAWFYALLLFFLFSFFCTTDGSTAQISYSDHCASVVPEYTPTFRVRKDFTTFELTISYYRGGEKILGKKNTSSDLYFNSSDISFTFYTTRNNYETNTTGIYKVQAYLMFRLPHAYRNYSGYGRSYHRSVVYGRFLLNGFFSEHSGKLCMVGKASWQSAEGKPLNLEAVFEFNYARKNSTLFTSLAKGTLKSLSSSSSPITLSPLRLFHFPLLYDYNYTLASKGLGGGCLEGNDIPHKQSFSLQPRSICSMFSWRSYDFVLEHAAGCKSMLDCGPFEAKTAYLSLYAFQCLEDEEKLRYALSFQDRSYSWHYYSFDPKSRLTGEGSWNSEKNQLCIVACRILNPCKSLQDVRVGDCLMRLSIRFPVIWTIKDSSSIVGLIWTNKTTTDPGYFKNIKVSSFNNYGKRLPGLRYECTQIGKARESCPKKEVVKKNGDNFPKGNSYDTRFDMSVKHSEEQIGCGNGVPISVNEELYGGNSEIMTLDSDYEVEESTSTYGSQMNISYKMTFSYINLREKIFSLNSSLNQWGQLVISAEGFYDEETGHLCMVGCRELYSQNASEKSLDARCAYMLSFPH